VTIVLTTHYLEEAQELCDTIAIVNRGQVVACEPTGDLLKRLDTRTVVITSQAPLTEVPKLKGFEGRLRKDGSLAVAFKTGETGVEQVLAAVRAAGVGIKDLATEDPSLEDVFLSLTYGDPKAESPPAPDLKLLGRSLGRQSLQEIAHHPGRIVRRQPDEDRELVALRVSPGQVRQGAEGDEGRAVHIGHMGHGGGLHVQDPGLEGAEDIFPIGRIIHKGRA